MKTLRCDRIWCRCLHPSRPPPTASDQGGRPHDGGRRALSPPAPGRHERPHLVSGRRGACMARWPLPLPFFASFCCRGLFVAGRRCPRGRCGGWRGRPSVAAARVMVRSRQGAQAALPIPPLLGSTGWGQRRRSVQGGGGGCSGPGLRLRALSPRSVVIALLVLRAPRGCSTGQHRPAPMRSRREAGGWRAPPQC